MGNWLIHHELERQASWRSDETAMIFEDTTYSFGAFDRRVNRTVRALRNHGVEPGDRIAVHGHNHVDLYALFFACSKLGAVYSPISTFQSARNVAYICDVLTPRYVFYTRDVVGDTLPSVRTYAESAAFVSLDAAPGATTLDDLIKGFEGTVPSGSDDHEASAVHNLMWTSGTTGRPKGVVRDHRATIHFADPLTDAFRPGPAHVRLTVNDMMFAAPYLQYGFPTTMSGATNVILRRFDPVAVRKACTEYGITVMLLVFTQGTAFLDYLAETGATVSLDTLFAIVPSAERARELAALTDELYQIYATTEVGVPFAERLDAPYRDQPGIGKPGRGTDVRLLPAGATAPPSGPPEPGDDGEVLVRGETTMTRYFDPENQDRYVTDGWVHTGDHVEVTTDGDVVFVGRTDDRLRSGGLNVYPSEIEAVLAEHPAIVDSVVVGVADELWGQRICALVVADHPDDPDRLEHELDEYCRASEALTNEMRPKTYAFVDSRAEVPTGAVNKVDRGAIVSRFFD